MEKFLRLAKNVHGYSEEQALGMLLWHRHDTEAALNDLPNYIPMPSDWMKEDKDLFKSGYEVTQILEYLA